MPSPATSFTQLYEFETNLATGMKAALGTITGFAVYAYQDTEIRVRPRIECHAENVRRVSLQQNFDKSGVARDNHYGCTMRFKLIWKREDTNAAAIAAAIGAVRVRMAPPTQAFDGTTLPLYEILVLTETGTSPATEEGEDVDVLDVTYGCEFGVPAYAYPTP